MRMVTDALRAPAPWGLWRYRLDARRAVAGGSLSEGGNVYAWCADTLDLGEPDAIERALIAGADTEHGLAVLPFLAGERSPGWSARARGAIAGLSLATTPIDILRASLESVALRLSLIYDLLAPLTAPDHEIVASGGALVRSPAWAQMIADALGRPLLVAREREASSRGVALLASAALGRLGDLGAAARQDGVRVQPDARRHQRYGDLRARQARLYAALVGDGGAPAAGPAPPLPRPTFPVRLSNHPIRTDGAGRAQTRGSALEVTDLKRAFDLAGRVAVVTGGNGGIGLGMARGMAAAGAAIVVAGGIATRAGARWRSLKPRRRGGGDRGRRRGRGLVVALVRRRWSGSAASTCSSTTPG